METPILEEILEIASFGYDDDGKLVLTMLKTDLIGNHQGDHVGNHQGDHVGTKKATTKACTGAKLTTQKQSE